MSELIDLKKEYLVLVKSFARDMNILLVDDNKSDIEFYKILFGKFFKVCDIAKSGLEALELYKNKPKKYYDLICTDIQMPDMDGLELVKNIRKLSLKQSIIVFTGVEDIHVNQNIAFYYIDGLLPKPIQKDKLFTLLYRVLKRISDEKDYEKYVETLENNMIYCSVVQVEEIMKKLKTYSNYKEIAETIDLLEQIVDSDNIEENVIEKVEPDFVDDDFFTFEDTELEEEIDTNYLEEQEKLSAEEFMKSDFVDQDVIDDILEMLDEYESRTISIEGLQDTFKEEFKKIINKFIVIFNMSYEFKELSYGLEKLNSKVINKIDSDMENADIFRMLFDSVILDLKKFTQEVLIDKSAVDIHYLDASLFANITQIDMMLENL